jgi:hypothetical protein
MPPAGLPAWALLLSLTAHALLARASPHPLAFPDQSAAILNNNAPFSGTIYILNPQGGSSGSSCPADTGQLCTSGSTNW